MGRFSSVAQTDATKLTSRRPYMKAGHFKVRVVSCKAIAERTGDLAFVVEFDVLESNNPEIPEGVIHSWFQRLTGKSKDIGPGEMKSFIAICYDVDPRSEEANEQVTEEVCELVVNDDPAQGPVQPLAGIILELDCAQVLTKDKKDFTRHVWSKVREQAA